MGREVRRVPPGWQHPKDREGDYIPLYPGCGEIGFEAQRAEWDEEYSQWQKGLRRNYGDGAEWAPIEEPYADSRYTEYAGACPSPDDFMPRWDAKVATHFVMYETTTEGTPISPAFATREELARWLTDNGASAFGGMTASYEQWLATCYAGSAPSFLLSVPGTIESGVAAAPELTGRTVEMEEPNEAP